MICKFDDNQATKFSTPDGAVLINLCGRCAAKHPTYIPVTPMTPECRECASLGKCCRTTNVKEAPDAAYSTAV